MAAKNLLPDQVPWDVGMDSLILECQPFLFDTLKLCVELSIVEHRMSSMTFPDQMKRRYLPLIVSRSKFDSEGRCDFVTSFSEQDDPCLDPATAIPLQEASKL